MTKNIMVKQMNWNLEYQMKQLKEYKEKNDNYWTSREYEKYCGMVIAYHSIDLITSEERDRLTDKAIEIAFTY